MNKRTEELIDIICKVSGQPRDIVVSLLRDGGFLPEEDADAPLSQKASGD